MSLVECVPNFSEGRDRGKVDEIIDAMRIPGVYVLDREMDADHNRSVVTLAGDKEAIGEAAIRGVGRAAELIDLNLHRGEHPRVGAADVVPFIPIEDASLEDCVKIARNVGEEIWRRFRIPVYLYEAAATVPERQNLENIRRGQFEVLREEITVNTDRKPDFGEARLHPTAGATVVGARKFLIAYNIDLNTEDLQIARSVAKAVRFSSGGLRYVKAMGVRVRGVAQVSMNLTDFEQTSMARVFAMVKQEAARFGATPLRSEIIGLIPRKALEEVAEWFLRIENFDPSLVLENRLAAVMSSKAGNEPTRLGSIRSGVEPFVEQLAAATAVPGGGSAAAAAGAMAAALAHMVAAMTHGRKNFTQYERELANAMHRLTEIREELKAAIDEDAQAFQALLEARRQAKASAAGTAESAATAGAIARQADDAVRRADKQVVIIPLRVAERSREIEQLSAGLRGMTSPRMASDLTVAASLARAALEGALANVEINLPGVQDQDFLKEVRERLRQLS